MISPGCLDSTTSTGRFIEGLVQFRQRRCNRRRQGRLDLNLGGNTFVRCR